MRSSIVFGSLLIAAVAVSAAFAGEAPKHQPEVFKLTDAQDMKLHIKRLEERVQALTKQVEALQTHTHEMPYGVAIFYPYLTPNGGDRVAVSLPFFTNSTPGDVRYTKEPTLRKAR
jgi:hypothetical protein